MWAEEQATKRPGKPGKPRWQIQFQPIKEVRGGVQAAYQEVGIFVCRKIDHHANKDKGQVYDREPHVGVEEVGHGHGDNKGGNPGGYQEKDCKRALKSLAKKCVDS